MNRTLLRIFAVALLAVSIASCAEDDPYLPSAKAPLQEDEYAMMVEFATKLKLDSLEKYPWNLNDIRTWKGVRYGYDAEKDRRYVVEIDIDAHLLKNTEFPQSGYSVFTHLKKFRFCAWPFKVFTFPADLCDCPLEDIEIRTGNLVGALPKEIGKLAPTLKKLSISHTRLESIPEEVGLLVDLEVFDLMFNKLTGEVPLIFNNFKKKEILLTFNEFTSIDWEKVEAGYQVPYIRGNKYRLEIPDSVKESSYWDNDLAYKLDIINYY